jgi:hypothetical protein
MAAPARPNIDVHGTLDDAEWLELYRESLRATRFWAWLAIAAAVTVLAAGVSAAFGAPTGWDAAVTLAVLGVLVMYAFGYVWLGPMLRCRRVGAAERTMHWRIGAERFAAEQAGRRLELRWPDVAEVRVTRRLLALRLRGDRGVLGLPRRDATALGESLIVGWAEAAGARISGRRSSRR